MAGNSVGRPHPLSAETGQNVLLRPTGSSTHVVSFGRPYTNEDATVCPPTARAPTGRGIEPARMSDSARGSGSVAQQGSWAGAWEQLP